MSEWQPIETAPKDGSEILVTSGYTCAVIWWGDENSGNSEYGSVTHKECWLWLVDDGKNEPIHYRGWSYLTHWMPLPAPPL